METCECCWSRKGKPVCVDDDMETYLCGPCVKSVKAEGMTVEVIAL